MALPFTFAWVDKGTAWDPVALARFDENIYSFKINHEEGQIPTLDLTIRNPRIGLLNPTRKRWGWLGYKHPTRGLIPLFYGMLNGVPTDMFKELVAIQLLARSPTFIADKQAVAETMKVRPYYDPFFLDDRHRDDPDSILEGWSAFWHIDRLTNATTSSDVLNGEDGTVLFDQNSAFYESVSMQLGQPPLVNVRVEASVNWTQRTSGYFDVPPVSIASYTGDSFMGDWPKPGSGLGGGYTVETSFVTDTFHVGQTPTTNYSSSWTNTDPNPGQCSNASATSSSSGPALLSPNPLTCVLTEYLKSGLCFPDSDPPQNIPAEIQVTGMIVPCWFLKGAMTIRYDVSREYSELLSFDLTANVQSILADPLVDQDTELLTLQSINLGNPILNVLAWTPFAGQQVPIAQIIWPNNPTKPGGLAYQICVQSGIAGAAEPTFSDIPGETTGDGTVVWASLGDSAPTSIAHWSPGSGVPVGTMMLIMDQRFNVNSGNLEDVPGSGSYYLCLTPGYTNGNFNTFTYVPPVTSNDEPTPAPRTVSILNQPTYSTAPGTIINDGSVRWMVLGPNPPSLQIPIGGTATNVTANNYFPTARGRWSREYAIMRARARLRYRARAVTLEWDSPFDLVVDLSCRKNATLYDPRLPGGAATGKIIAYSMECSGSDGKLIGHVKVGVSVGYGNSVAAVTGTPEYAAPGYAQAGWQRYDEAQDVPGSGDVSYTSPAYAPFDDGLQFPLTWEQVSDGGVFSNTLAAQKEAITKSFAVAQKLEYLQMWAGKTLSQVSDPSSVTSGLTPTEAWSLEEQQLALASQNTPYVMAANPIVWTALMKPCSGNGPFEGSYAIITSPLEVTQGINLSAASSP